MNAQRDEILDQLTKHGWDAVPVEAYELEWWADEMWLLTSQWSPVGCQAYLTFVVHPIFAAPDRKKGEGVWEALASGEKPTYMKSTPDGFSLNLRQGWKEGLPELLEHLSGWRNKQRAKEADGS
jgi:hypothetical protein